MDEPEIFIGREHELQMIDQLIFDPSGARHILPITADGGVGKTYLLREINRRYLQDARVVIVKIEFSEVNAVSMPSLTLQIFSQLQHYLPEEDKESFLTLLANWEQAETTEVLDEESLTGREQQEAAFYDLGVRLVQGFAAERRILFLADTLEAVRSLELADQINRLAARFENSVIVVMGRPYDNVTAICTHYPALYQGWTIHAIYTLQPFTLPEITDYFTQVIPVEMTRDLREKIHLLTEGNPILIAIASEWLKRNFALPADVDLPLAQLRNLGTADLQVCQERFEFELIDRIRSLRQPIDWAILYLAYFNRRYDPRILQLVMEIEQPEELETIIAELMTLVFVRKSMSTKSGLLHDEAERLIRLHAWPLVDPNGAVRRTLTERVIDSYYLPEIARLKAIIQAKRTLNLDYKLAAPQRRSVVIPEEVWLERELEIECMDYCFRISEERGWAYLEQLFDAAMTSNYSLVHMEAIVGAVRTIAPAQTVLPRFQVRMARMLFAKGEVVRAFELADKVRQTKSEDAEATIQALMVLVDGTDDPVKKIDFCTQALAWARMAGKSSYEAQVLNALGLAHRRQGQWTPAEDAYRQVLRLLDETREANQYANTLNNLAYVQLLNGKPSRADSLAERALRLRRAQGNTRGLSLSYTTKGHIAAAFGDYSDSLRYHHIAYDLCISIDDHDNAILIQLNIANAERHHQNFAKVRELLAPGLSHKRADIRARALRVAAKNEVDEAQFLQLQGAQPEAISAKYVSAEGYAHQALQAVRQAKDAHLMAGILFDLALLTFLREQREAVEYLNELESILQNHNYLLERGRLIELRGDFAFARADFTIAFDYYIKACIILAGFSPASFRQTFRRVRDHFFDLPSAQRPLISSLIEAQIGRPNPESLLIMLRELCVDDDDEFAVD